MEQVKRNNSQGWKSVLKIILPYLVVVVILQLIGALITGVDIIHMKDIKQTPVQLLVINFMSMIGSVGIVWLFTTKLDKKSFVSIGFEKVLVGKDILMGLMIGFLIMLSGFSILIFTQQLQFVAFKPDFINILYSIGLFIFVAVAEEVFTRGYILRNLAISFNKYVALIISALVFCVMHLANPNITLISLLILFLSGLVLGLSYLFTKNLWFPIALHFSWNFFQGTVFGFNVSGMKIYRLIETKYTLANSWNGGLFGFEGSILAVLFLIPAIVLIYFIFRNRKTEELYEVLPEVEPVELSL
ncbi:MAG: type II CAAX endopeptidase family protein [Paludibacter sp.]|nr:type II CAAX endopeptidase family protein [Paludibacter sp.]